jgi:hypothetical protein
MKFFSPLRAIVYSPESIPPCATKLTIICYNVPYLQDFFLHFPPTLNILSIQHFNGNLLSLPASLTHLVTSSDFDSPVLFLPPALTHLVTGHQFNQTIDSLSSSLTHLVLGFSFAQPVTTLPPSLTHLIFGYKFNQLIDEFLPLSLSLKWDTNSTSL